MIKPVEIDHMKNEDNLHNSTWRINKNIITLKDVGTKEALVTALNDIYTCLINFTPKEHLINKIGFMTIQKLTIVAYPEEAEAYLKHFKDKLTWDNSPITKVSLTKRIFGDAYFFADLYKPYQKVVLKIILGLTSESATLIKPIKIESIEYKSSNSGCAWIINNNKVVLSGNWKIDELVTALNDIYNCLINFTSKEHLINKIGFITIQKLTIAAYPEETEDYLKYFKNELTRDNIRIPWIRKSLTKRVFGEARSTFSQFHEPYRNLVMKVLGRSFTNENIKLIKPVEIQFIGRNKVDTWMINENEIVILEGLAIDRLMYLLNNIYLCLTTQKPIGFLIEQTGLLPLQKLMIAAYPEELSSYLIFFSESLIGTDHALSRRQLEECIFGSSSPSVAHCYEPFAKMLLRILTDADKQNTALKIKSNTIDIEQDRWTLFCTDGSQLKPVYFDFSNIPSKGIKREVKYYIKSIIDNAKVDEYVNIRQRLSALKSGLLYLVKQYSDIKNIASFNQIQVRWLLLYLQTEAKTRIKKTTYTPGFIHRIFIELKLLIDWMMETDIDLKTTIPTSNVFTKFGFPNIQSMHKNTEYIPEEVIEQLLIHINEISNVMVQRMFLIMMNTGFRYKEVSHLEDDCLIYDKESKVWLIRYIPWKILESRRKYGISDYAFTSIKDFILEEIELQKKDSEDLRLVWGLKKIFLQQYFTLSPKMFSSSGFNSAINSLIKKNNIIDMEGNIWHFTSKQCRKTVAVDMITNGATMHEVAQQLQQLSQRTAYRYYGEVRKMRLAKMNNEFYKKKFGLYISDEQLSRYNKEERKMLYVQFCLGEREVELGKCIKHPNEGPCSKRSGKTKCANCKQLCTGKQNLMKWLALRDHAQQRVDALIGEYRRENISDYEEYREYQATVHELKTYLNIIEKINREENA